MRLTVLALAAGELALAGYVVWALFIDETTAWIVEVVPDLEAIWRPMVFPSAVAGGVALALVITDRWLWLALAVALAGPCVSLWLLA